MAGSAAFERVCQALEQDTALDRLQARGTVRLALKEAGLDPAGVTGAQMAVVLEKLLPRELEVRGVHGSAEVCAALVRQLAAPGLVSEPAETPEAVFARLAER